MASRRHPYAPEIPINHANMLSRMGLSDEAERNYQKAISLQGQMEPGFRTHYHYSQHLLRKASQQHAAGDSLNAMTTMESAVQNIESAIRLTPAWIIDIQGRNLRIFIHEFAGKIQEANGDREGALASYNFASSIQSGNRAHYRAAVLIGRMGRDDWAKRRAPQALYKFIEARRRIDLAVRELPFGVSPTERQELTKYLDDRIALLKEAKVEPQE
jgi:tetratricopeptide (TPR) repeat protein